MRRFVPFCSLVLLVACTPDVSGSGQRVSRPREVGDFERVSAGGSFTLTIERGSPTRVVVTTDDNVQALVTAEVKEKTLHLGTSKDVDAEIEVAITTPRLTQLDLSGAAEAQVRGVEEKRLEIDASGAASITATGKVKALELEGSGAINFEGRDLHAQAVEVDLSGAGNATVFATESLDVEISGAGNVSYAGQPKEVKQEISGVGSLGALGGGMPEPAAGVASPKASPIDEEAAGGE